MPSVSKVLFYGVFVWVIPFGLGFAAFPLQDAYPKLFDSLMTLAVCFGAGFFGVQYLSEKQNHTSLSGLKIGLLWMGICMAIDLPIFLWAFNMPLVEYFQEIGLTYGMIPIIVYFLGRMVNRNS